MLSHQTEFAGQLKQVDEMLLLILLISLTVWNVGRFAVKWVAAV